MFIRLDKILLASRSQLTFLFWNSCFLGDLFLILNFVLFVKSHLMFFRLRNSSFWRFILWWWFLRLHISINVFMCLWMISHNSCCFHRRTIFQKLVNICCSNSGFLFSRKRLRHCFLLLYELCIILLILIFKLESCFCELWLHIFELIDFKRLSYRWIQIYVLVIFPPQFYLNSPVTSVWFILDYPSCDFLVAFLPSFHFC